MFLGRQQPAFENCFHDSLLYYHVLQGSGGGGGGGEYIARLQGRSCGLLASTSLLLSQASVLRERFRTVRLLLTLHAPLTLLVALMEKELSLHLCFLPEIDPVSRPLCVGGEKSHSDVLTHQYRER